MPWPRTRRKASRRFWGSARRVGAGSERIKSADEPSWAAGTRPTRGDENVTSEVAENRASANCFQNNTVASEGAGPCNLSLHQSGKWVFVANYHGGTSAVFPIGANGELGAASDVKRHDGALGPDRAGSAP